MSKYNELAAHRQPPTDDGTSTARPSLWVHAQLALATLALLGLVLLPALRQDPVLAQAQKDAADIKELRRLALRLHEDNVAMRLELDRLQKGRR